ncbi:MAG TPA: pilus assembly protein PilM [Syntrophorhabdaceae bacterium]|nr:pilus assembly protein PilM [Syntrophorhabdaceae bacterium]
MDILGVDIGTVSIKYVRCKGTAGKSIIASQGDYPYKGDFEDLELILADIRTKEGADVEAVVGLSSPDIIKKTFTIPRLPKKEQKDAMDWASAKALSSSLDGMVYEYLMLGQIEEKGVMKDEVLFVGAQKGWIERIASTFQRAGFPEVTLITDIAFGYVYALGEIGDKSVAVIDVGGKRTGLYIANGRRLMFAREILTASESFSDALMSGGPELSFDQAERYKREKGFDEEFSEIMKIPFERLAGEVQRTFSVYNQRYPEKPITGVYVTGRGAKIPRFFDKLEETLVEQVNYLETIQGIEDKYIPAHTLCMNLEVLPNLLPEGARKREQDRLMRRSISMATIAIAGILFLVSLYMWGASRNVDTRINMERKTLETMKRGLSTLGTRASNVLDTSDITFIRNEIQRKDLTFITLMKYLSSRIPGDVYLKSIEFGGDIQSDVPSSAQKTQNTPSSVQPAQGALLSSTSQPLKRTPVGDYYPLTLRGFIFGEPDALELSLFNLVLSLKQSGFIDHVEIVAKENGRMKGRPITEFIIAARCMKHEL